MVVMPAPTEVTTPLKEPIIATEVLLLVHVPPDTEDVSVALVPRHNVVLPLMLPPVELTVTTARVEHPQLATVYVIVAVPPDTPLTTPDEEPTVATDVLLLLHVPPPLALLSAVVAPGHTVSVPVIAAGVDFTVII